MLYFSDLNRKFGLVLLVFCLSGCSDNPSLKLDENIAPVESAEEEEATSSPDSSTAGEMTSPESTEIEEDTEDQTTELDPVDENDSQEPPATECDLGPGLAGEDVVLTFPWDGELRTWILHLPTDYDCTPRPLLIGAHAYLSDGHSFEHDVAQIFDHINDEGYIAIFPDALARSDSEMDAGVTSFNDGTSHYDDGPDGPTCTFWSWDYGIFSNCGPEEEERFCRWGTSCSDDLGFFRALVADVASRWTVDTDRIYMTGFSQGAITAQSFACPLSDILAAIAPLHGASANGYTCGPETKVSMMQVWGVNDVGINGHEEPSIDGLIYDGADETALVWAEAQECDEEATPYETVSDGIWGWSCSQHANCSTGADVVNCQWDGNHFWGRTPMDGDFMWDAVWAFLSSQSR